MSEKFNEEEIRASRKLSDEKLVEGGAEIKEGKLQITDEQYKHLHKEMEMDLAANLEAKGGVVDYIKSHIESDLSWQPKIRQEVAKTLEVLLKLSKSAGKDYFLQQLVLLGELENNLRIRERTGRGPVSLHESKKAAMNFAKLDNEQRREVEEYIQSMIEKEIGQTLEQYMTEKLSLEAEKSWDPDTQSTEEGKYVMSMLAMTQSSNTEDFTLWVPRGQEKSDGEIQSVIMAYYKDQGYTVESEFA